MIMTKTVIELGDVIYIPYRIKTIDIEYNDKVGYYCQSLLNRDSHWIYIAEESLSTVKTYDEPFDPEKFSG